MSEYAFFREQHENFPQEHTNKICTDLQGVCDVEGLLEEACNEGINHEKSENPPENKSSFRAVVGKSFKIFFHLLFSVLISFFDYIIHFSVCHFLFLKKHTQSDNNHTLYELQIDFIKITDLLNCIHLGFFV